MRTSSVGHTDRAPGWSDEAREAKRDELRNVLTAAVCAGGGRDGDVYYYQGMHDVAAVLLFEVGERPAYVLLRRLARCHLRDCTRRGGPPPPPCAQADGFNCVNLTVHRQAKCAAGGVPGFPFDKATAACCRLRLALHAAWTRPNQAAGPVPGGARLASGSAPQPDCMHRPCHALPTTPSQ